MFTAADSTHYYLVNENSLIARSTDASMTWQRNGAGARPYAIAVEGDDIMIAREYRSLFLSRNAGEFWLDIGSGENVPPHLSTLYALEPGSRPGERVGLASFARTNGERYIAMTTISVADGKVTEGTRLPDELTDTSGTLRMERVANASGTGATLVASNRNLMFASEDDGKTWTKRGEMNYLTYEMGSSDHGVAVVGEAMSRSVTALMYTTDGGAMWQEGGSFPRSGTSLLGLRAFDAHRFVCLGEILHDVNTVAIYIASTVDGGKTWTVDSSMRRSIFSNYLLTHWQDESNVFVFTRDTVYRSIDGGYTYAATPIPFPPDVVESDDEHLYLAAAGNMGGKLRIADLAVSAVPSPVERASFRARLATNPVRDEAAVVVELGRGANVVIEVHDVLGRRVAGGDGQRLEQGAHEIRLDCATLPSGRYTVVVNVGEAVHSLQLVVLR